MAAKGGLYAVCQALYAAPVQVVFGRPGTDLEDDIVAIGDTRADLVHSGQVEQRREEITVTFSSYRGGGEEAQQTVTDRVYAMKDALVAAPRPAFGGAAADTDGVYVAGFAIPNYVVGMLSPSGGIPGIA